ncbi:MAG: ABC transporter substrate-binding protein [Treponema sp.]|jgi:iron complex transport system substrate-binding protein|nr:ABC transporter substrate-binding protein [Treponema sp.]
MRKPAKFGLFPLVLFFALSGCFSKETTKSSSSRYFEDSSGRRIELPAEIKTISPSGWLAQIFLISAAPDMLASLSVPLSAAEKEFLPSFDNLPVTGTFYGQGAFNPEEIARIAPDVIIDIGAAKENIADDMDAFTKSTGIPVIHITADLRNTPDAFRLLGSLLSIEEKCEALAVFCEKTLLAVDNVMGKTGLVKKQALFCVGPRGMSVLAKGSFHCETFDWIADNVAVVNNPSARATGNETNPEQILLIDPQVIVFGSESVYLKDDPFWKQLSAFKTNQYFRTPEGPYNWMGFPPSINRYLGILWLAKQLYPQFADYDLYDECAEYYRLFYGYDLSRIRFAQLTGR